MQRRLCEMSEAKWSITEAKCLQISHNKYASQRDAISHSMGNLMLSHSAGMQHPDISIAGISKRFHFASLHYIFSAYLPTHIKFLTEFRCILSGQHMYHSIFIFTIMIIGKLSDTQSVERLHPLFREAFEWLRANAATAHAAGISPVVLKEGKLWANVETPQMKAREEQVLEVHRKYIDIHVPVDKVEVMGYLPTSSLKQVREAYDANRDIAFYTDAPMAYVTIQPGEFAIVTPEDAHAPIIGEGEVKKICMKVECGF